MTQPSAVAGGQPRRPSALAGALAGVLTAAVAMGIAQLAAGLTVPQSSPVLAVGQASIDLTPPALKDFAISTFGADDKNALLIGILVVLAAFAAVIGMLAVRRLAVGLWGLAVFAAIGLAAALTRPDANAGYVVPTLAGAAAGAYAMTRLIRAARALRSPASGARSAGPAGGGPARSRGARAFRTKVVPLTPPDLPSRAPADEPGDAGAPEPVGAAEPAGGAGRGSSFTFLPNPADPGPPRGPARRRFLTVSAVAAVSAAAGALVGRELITRKNVSQARAALRFPKPAVTAPPLPPGSDLDIPGLSSFITPDSGFYRVDTALLLPEVDPANWQLRIHGMVQREFSLTFDELLRRPLVEDYVTLTCVSNPVGGPYVGNAKWLGARLADLIRQARPLAGASQLLCTSVDGFTSGTPLQVVLDGRDALLAVAMNDQALPVAHGFPARMVVPGLYGYVSATKWVTDIEVTTFSAADAYWVQRGWSQQAPIKTESRIDVPAGGATLAPGRTPVAGVAWAQHKGVAAVEVRVDGGAWQEARLAAVPDIDTWRQWVWEWDATPGNHLLEARATDATGYTQTALAAQPVPNGASGYPSAAVTVRSSLSRGIWVRPAVRLSAISARAWSKAASLAAGMPRVASAITSWPGARGGVTVTQADRQTGGSMSGDADAEFTKLAQEYLDDRAERHPDLATGLGDHRFDARLPDPSEAALASERRALDGWTARLEELDTEALSAEHRVDAAMMADSVARRVFEIDELAEHTWNPLLANPGRAVYLLLARDFAPLPDRLASLAGRLAEVPGTLAEARRQLGPMPRVHLETAIGQFDGTIALVGKEIDAALAAAPTSIPLIDQVRPAALEALAEHQAWLSARLAEAAPGPDGDRNPRIGPERFARKLSLTLSASADADAIRARARADLDRIGEQIAELAGQIDGSARPGPATVRQVLDRLARDVPDDATILGFCRDALAAQIAFVSDRQLVTVYDDPVEVIPMPEIDRGVAVAYCDSPGPLETAPLATFLAVSPTPAEWPPERVASFYREYNRHMVHNLMVHEAMPGHYLQQQHSRRFTGSGAAIRAALRSGSFVEGWAVYAERIMAEHGYPGDGDPRAVRMQQLKMQLRTTINAILDAGIHGHGMTEAEAMTLMTSRGHQEEGEAAGKWRRALLTSAQLSTYYVGYTEISDLADELRMANPGLADREIHDRMLAHGSPPVRLLRTLIAP